MEAHPVKVIPVHEYLRPKLVELYESDCIFDKFEVSGVSAVCSMRSFTVPALLLLCTATYTT